MSALHGLSAIQRDLLAAVAALDDPHGLAVKAELEQTYRTSNVNHSRLYPNLDELDNMGLIKKSSTTGTANRYRLTDQGRDQLAKHADELRGALE